VQEQYDLNDGSALRLTVARYYTPIGRNIQKPYNKGRAAYNGELAERFANGELVNGDTVTKHIGPAYKTKSGRIVYGGGGITPDVFIPFDTSNISSNVYVLFDNQLFNKFIYTYYQQNKAYFDQFKNPADFARRYNDTRTAWNSLVSYAAKNAVTVQNVPEHDKKDIEKQIKIWLARQIWRMEGYYEVSNADDTAISKAMAEMKK
jgi:carboxyl-terminal processing protease